jgi:hypothetical protein
MSWWRRSRDGGDQVAGRPDGQQEVVASVRAQVEAFLDQLEEAGAPVGRAQLDGTAGSLRALDDLLGEFHTHVGEAPPEVVSGAAGYLMEVARREHGGVYQSGGEDDPLVLVVQHDRGRVGLLATSKVRGRVVNGPEDDLPFFYEGFARAVRDRVSATIV